MHMLFYTLINSGRKHKGLVSEIAFQEGNWAGDFVFMAYPL